MSAYSPVRIASKQPEGPIRYTYLNGIHAWHLAIVFSNVDVFRELTPPK